MSGKSTRRDFLKLTGLGAAEVVLFSAGLKQASAAPQSPQSSQTLSLPKQTIPTPSPISIRTSSKSMSLNFRKPNFDSLSTIGMDDASLVTTEWDRYTTSDGRDTPYNSKIHVYQKIFKPTDVNSLIEYQVLLDFVSRRKVFNCLDTIEFYFDTKNKRTIRADNGQENTTPYGHPTHWLWIVQIKDDSKRYAQVISNRVHPIGKCWKRGDYKHMWQEIRHQKGGGYQAVSWLDKSPNESEKHWQAAFRFPDRKYRNPDRLREIPTVIWMGHLPKGVTAINDPYMDGHWIEALRHPTYTSPWTPRGSGNDVRTGTSIKQEYGI